MSEKPAYKQTIRLSVKCFHLTTLRSLVYREVVRMEQQLAEKEITPNLIPVQKELIEELVELEKYLAKRMVA